MTATTTTAPALVGGFFIRWNSADGVWDAGRGDRVWGDADTLAEAVATVREWTIDEGLCPECAEQGDEVYTVDGSERNYASVLCPVNECRWQIWDEEG